MQTIIELRFQLSEDCLVILYTRFISEYFRNNDQLEVSLRSFRHTVLVRFVFYRKVDRWETSSHRFADPSFHYTNNLLLAAAVATGELH